jgi:hypothetical protein
MDFGQIGSIFLALAAYRLAAPALDRIANHVWGNPHSATIMRGAGKSWREVERVPVDPLRPELGDKISFEKK